MEVESNTTRNEPLISVIIPCYNHGKYLHDSINSVYAQKDYSNYEIIIIDDGSVDDTRQIAAGFPNVKYVYQRNAGLSAARNTGIKNSSGKYLVFLDADDWLLPDAMAVNFSYLKDDDNIAFVSGAYKYLFEQENRYVEIRKEVNADHYCAFLESNYIGMHATVLYQRWCFDKLQYDTTLKACEDYDIYLRIARQFPVVHHTHFIAVYRIHTTNMSGNTLLMLNSALHVLKLQERHLKNGTERACYEKGIIDWQLYYADELYEKLLTQLHLNQVKKEDLQALKKYNKKLYAIIILKRNQRTRSRYRRKVPSFLKNIYRGAKKMLGK